MIIKTKFLKIEVVFLLRIISGSSYWLDVICVLLQVVVSSSSFCCRAEELLWLLQLC